MIRTVDVLISWFVWAGDVCSAVRARVIRYIEVFKAIKVGLIQGSPSRSSRTSKDMRYEI